MFDRHKGVRIFKTAWRGKYWIELAPDRTEARDMFVTVRNTGDSTVNDQIKQHLDVLRHGLSYGEWSWYFYLKDSYKNWSHPGVLLKMHGQDVEVLEYVRKEILAVVNIAGPVIDEVVSSPRP